MACTNGTLQSMKTLKFSYTKFLFILTLSFASFYLLFFCSSSDSVKNRCLLNIELQEGRRTDGSATFFLLISTELLSHRNQELFFLPLVCVWSVSFSVAAFTGLWGHGCSFLLGAHRCKTISRAAASSVGREWQGAGKTFLCEEADV